MPKIWVFIGYKVPDPARTVHVYAKRTALELSDFEGLTCCSSQVPNPGRERIKVGINGLLAGCKYDSILPG